MKISNRAVAAAIPVAAVNAVAFFAQLGFMRQHVPWHLPGQILVALTLESIAVYLAFQAHLAQLADDSALRLRLFAYGVALIIAALNYSHYCAPGWRPTAVAVTAALCSAISPWLWGIHSRRESRDRLLAAGKIDKHALRLGATRWVWHPLRSFQVMFRSTWRGTTSPRKAIRGWERERQEKISRKTLPASPAATLPQGLPPALPAGSPANGEGTLSRGSSGGGSHGSRRKRGSGGPPERVTNAAAEMHFADDLMAGNTVSANRIHKELHVGWPRATELREHLAGLAAQQGGKAA